MKAFLILPEMPNGCAECILARINLDGELICAASADNPGRCPLTEMPERKEEERIDYTGTYVSIDNYAKGWNAAIKAIEGSGEDDN